MEEHKKQVQGTGKKLAKLGGAVLAGAMLLAPVQNADAGPLSHPNSMEYARNGFEQSEDDERIWSKSELDEYGTKNYIAIDEDFDGKMSRGDILVERNTYVVYPHVGAECDISVLTGERLPGPELGRKRILSYIFQKKMDGQIK
jgi:hypothetical protein